MFGHTKNKKFCITFRGELGTDKIGLKAIMSHELKKLQFAVLYQ